MAGPTSIDRRNRQRLVNVNANLVGNTPLNDVTVPVQRAIAQMQAQGLVPAGYTLQMGGQAEDQAKAFGNIFLALGLSILLEYMLLAALYESMILPLRLSFARSSSPARSLPAAISPICSTQISMHACRFSSRVPTYTPMRPVSVYWEAKL